MRFSSFIVITSLMIFGQPLNAAPLDVGAKFPKVTVTLDTGETAEIPANTSEDYVLVYFYPKSNTPGCTKQACSLRDAYEVLTDRGVSVFGVSKDSVKSQQDFKKKYELPFSLVADSNSKVIEAFGVPKKLGFASRQAFLFKNGTLIWRDLAASTSKQASDVLAFLDNYEKKAN